MCKQPSAGRRSDDFESLRLRFGLIYVVAMRKVNNNNMEELVWASPKGKFAGAGKQVCEALGRKPFSRDLMDSHPFDVDIFLITLKIVSFPDNNHSEYEEFCIFITGKCVD